MYINGLLTTLVMLLGAVVAFTCATKPFLVTLFWLWLCSRCWSCGLPVTQPTVSKHWRHFSADSNQGKSTTGLIFSWSTTWGKGTSNSTYTGCPMPVPI